MSRSEILAAYRAGLIASHRVYHLLCDLEYNAHKHQ